MKKIKSIFLLPLTVFLFSASCKKESQLSLLPPATQTGANTFGCLVNGQAFTPDNLIGFPPPPSLKTSYYCLNQNSPYFNSNLNSGYYLSIYASNESGDMVTNVGMRTDSLMLPLSEGETLILTQYNTGGASGNYWLNSVGYSTNSDETGQLTVTHLDTIKQIISGTFYFNAVNTAGALVKITNGRFDAKYTSVH